MKMSQGATVVNENVVGGGKERMMGKRKVGTHRINIVTTHNCYCGYGNVAAACSKLDNFNAMEPLQQDGVPLSAVSIPALKRSATADSGMLLMWNTIGTYQIHLNTVSTCPSPTCSVEGELWG